MADCQEDHMSMEMGANNIFGFFLKSGKGHPINWNDPIITSKQKYYPKGVTLSTNVQCIMSVHPSSAHLQVLKRKNNGVARPRSDGITGKQIEDNARIVSSAHDHPINTASSGNNDVTLNNEGTSLLLEMKYMRVSKPTPKAQGP